MKPLLLSTHDLHGGAARATHRLYRGLRKIGVDASMLVQSKTGDDQGIHGPAGRLSKAMALAGPRLERLALRMYPRRVADGTYHPGMFFPSNLHGIVNKAGTDVVHLHWVAGGFLNVDSISRLKGPVVWTLHDMWAFTGGCHYDDGCARYVDHCGQCPILGSDSSMDLSRLVWKKRNRNWRELDLTIVTPSKWLAQCASKSSLLSRYRVEVIPNAIDTGIFRPIPKGTARQIMRLPEGKRLILFGALSATSDHRKGFSFLQEALRELAGSVRKDDYALVIFGANETAEKVDYGFMTYHTGHLHDDISLAMLYSAADVFVAPSLQDNLPNTVMESLACGVPSVAFRIGGMPDLIDHEQTGYLASPQDVPDLASGINWVLQDEERWQRLSRNAREKAESKFACEFIAKRHLRLYEQVAGKSHRK